MKPAVESDRLGQVTEVDLAPEVLLVRYPELYRNHLCLADYLRGWADRLGLEVATDRALTLADRDYLVGYHKALVDLGYHLRHGDCLPGGPVCSSPDTCANGHE